ncbi:hypothetical protein FFLO_00469 [Filobasidium floriforme]|uniref:Conserved oligomeric Golgi complex subunit 1 n=1 Tax=Filobasidium floriforme TaxID=5210 RepID=A0A8K0JRX6_9TREE|nr:uncharacterized protein HD553DRAFT_363390 [Filobasidium floriforme]KAG7575305.1 hypothetical protein FFLO_00469 [Filobasidium floriforme]KAH8078902.1 hypothetical protein HD553DRAFT_363390 [Filobasidium floriforme]
MSGPAGRRSNSQPQYLSSAPGGMTGKDGQWATMDPDEVFRRLNVKEVKKVEGLLRASAAGKQGELRNMVSERYRDLLLSTSQISQLRDSSLRLSTTLKHIESLCASPKTIGTNGNGQVDVSDVKNQLPTAASVKLLLDVPEALYSYLAGKQFLEAAYLWLLTRVVKEELVSSSGAESDEKGSTNQTFLPLVQKQWEILLPLRGQIVERATTSLRDRAALANALLAILLLEAHNNPLPEILDIFLAQRAKSLQDIHTGAVQGRTSAVGFTFGRSTERAGRSPITPRSALPEETGRKNRHARKDSRLNAAEMLRSLSPAPRRLERSNSGSSAKGEDGTARKAKAKERKRLAEQARASKIFEDSVIGAGGVSAASLLRAMPSSQILQAYLPAPIKNFSPFIGSIGEGTDKSELQTALDTWFEQSLKRLESQAKDWLGGLETVTDVWQVKRQFSTVLTGLRSLEENKLSSEELDRLSHALSTAFVDRARSIWQNRLDATAHALEDGLQDDIDLLMAGNNNAAQDLHPSLSFFAPITFPDHRSVNSSFTSTELPAFTSTLKKRLHSRTPILDRRLAELERMALEIRSDLRSLKEDPEDAVLLDRYRKSATQTAQGIVKDISKSLEMVRQHSGVDADRASTCLFIGRLALALMTQSKAMSVLLLNKRAVGDVASALDSVYMASLTEWKERTVQDGLDVFAEAITGSVPETRSVDLGNGVIFALQEMATALFDSGLPIEYRSAATEDVCKDFGSRAIKLAKDKQMDLPADQRSMLEAIASGAQAGLSEVAGNELRKTQLLLYPATSYIKAHSGKPSDARYAELLPLGIPKTNHEYVSPVPLVKPSARFSMLSIV